MTGLLVLLTALGLVGRASAATTGPIWTQGPTVGPVVSGSGGETLMPGITCTSRGNCVAVGFSVSSTGQAGQVQAESNGTWGASTAASALPAAPAPSAHGSAILQSVSCQSATACVAVGSYQDAEGGQVPLVLPLTISGATVTPGTPVSPKLPSAPAAADPASDPNTQPTQNALTSVSCAASGCTAVGYYEDDQSKQMPLEAVGGTGETWTSTEVGALPTGPNAGSDTDGASLDGVSCPSTGPCEAVGNYNTANNSYPWAITLGGAAAGVEVSLPADAAAVPTSSANNSPIPGSTPGLNGVSCPSSGACEAVGAYAVGSGSQEQGIPYAVAITNNDPQPVVRLSAAGPIDIAASISCVDQQDCVTAGYSEMSTTAEYVPEYASESAGAWSSFGPFPDASTATNAISISLSIWCTGVEDCLVPTVTVSQSGSSISTFLQQSVAPLTAGQPQLPAATVGQAYSATLTASGGTGQNQWSLSTGALPAGLSLDPATGVISGTPTAAGQQAFVATDTDSGPPSQSVQVSGSITVAAAPTPAPTSGGGTATGTTTATPTSPAPSGVTRSASELRISFLRVTGTKVTVVLSCEGAPCSGTLKLIGTERLRGSTPVAITAAARRAHIRSRQVVLAVRRYALGAQKSQTVTLSLTSAGRVLLRRLHTIHAQLPVTPQGAHGPALVRRVTFRAPAAGKVKRG